MAQAGQRKFVLVVDPSAEERGRVKEAITHAFPEVYVVESTDGYDAQLKLTKQKFDLLITEIKLPKMDGNQLLQSLKTFDRAFRPSRVLILSALVKTTGPVDPAKSVAYMAKPLIVAQMVDFIQQIFHVGVGAEAPRFDVNIVNLLSDVTLFVFKSFGSGVPLKRGRIVLSQDSTLFADWAVIVPLQTKGYSGQVMLAFKEETMRKILGHILKKEITVFDEAHKQLILKAAQTIGALFKREMQKTNHTVSLEAPSVIQAQGGTILTPQKALRLATCLESSFGPLFLELHVSQSKAKSPSI